MRTILHRVIFGLIASGVASCAALANFPDLSKVNFSAPEIKLGNQSLVLNGRGTYMRFIFKIYEISLFLEKKSSDSKKILESSETKVLNLKFLRDVSASQLRSSLLAGYHENCGSQCEALRPYIEEVNSKIPDLKEGESLVLRFYPSGLILKTNLGSYLEIANSAFSRVLLSIWLGSDPPSSSLKKDILGQS